MEVSTLRGLSLIDVTGAFSDAVWWGALIRSAGVLRASLAVFCCECVYIGVCGLAKYAPETLVLAVFFFRFVVKYYCCVRWRVAGMWLIHNKEKLFLFHLRNVRG